eukprot:44570-Eustigmatos_ZCMA.PRE.1
MKALRPYAYMAGLSHSCLRYPLGAHPARPLWLTTAQAAFVVHLNDLGVGSVVAHEHGVRRGAATGLLAARRPST